MCGGSKADPRAETTGQCNAIRPGSECVILERSRDRMEVGVSEREKVGWDFGSCRSWEVGRYEVRQEKEWSRQVEGKGEGKARDNDVRDGMDEGLIVMTGRE